jgi:hypothetical protein
MSEIQYLQGQKNASNHNECKLKPAVSRQVYDFLPNEIPLAPQCPFMDLNTLKSRGKAGTIFFLAHQMAPTLLFSNLDHTIKDMLNMSKLDSLIQTQKFPAMIRKEQVQRRRPL